MRGGDVQRAADVQGVTYDVLLRCSGGRGGDVQRAVAASPCVWRAEGRSRSGSLVARGREGGAAGWGGPDRPGLAVVPGREFPAQALPARSEAAGWNSLPECVPGGRAVGGR